MDKTEGIFFFSDARGKQMACQPCPPTTHQRLTHETSETPSHCVAMTWSNVQDNLPLPMVMLPVPKKHAFQLEMVMSISGTMQADKGNVAAWTACKIVANNAEMLGHELVGPMHPNAGLPVLDGPASTLLAKPNWMHLHPFLMHLHPNCLSNQFGCTSIHF